MHPLGSTLDEYRRAFGGFEGPGLLPYAVAAFFDQGGRRAYVARVVHDYGPGSPLAPAVRTVSSPSSTASTANVPTPNT